MAAPTELSREALAGDLGDLADPARFHGALSLPLGDRGWLIPALRQMVLARACEERIGDMVTSGKVSCPCHLAIGQEAVAVGVALALRPTDRVFGAHRSHAHFIALGGSVHKLMAEVLGRDTGAARGMGGSMHLIDREHGLHGTVPIVGATIPIATGAALAAQMDGAGAVGVSFLGDGATEEGGFHESLNLAATLQLPALYIVENNLFASHLHISLRQPRNSVARYGIAHDVRTFRVDGNDVVAVAEAAREAVERMREEPGPALIEAVTYRWRGHVGPREDEDVGVQRSGDLEQWRQRDPVARLADALVAAGEIGADVLSAIVIEMRDVVTRAWNEAEADPYPPAAALLDRVYGRRA